MTQFNESFEKLNNAFEEFITKTGLPSLFEAFSRLFR